eukprot:5902613-Amphidinium_carterae.1
MAFGNLLIRSFWRVATVAVGELAINQTKPGNRVCCAHNCKGFMWHIALVNAKAQRMRYTNKLSSNS